MLRRRTLAVAAASALAGCGGGGGGGGGDGANGAPASVQVAHECLTEDDRRFRIQGPLPRQPDDDDAPDATLVVGGSEASAYLGWYDDAGRAERAAREQREHAKQFEGSVERHGGLTIIWVRGAETAEAERIEDCALS